ncbi:MAG: hypothetical protein WCR51_08735 [Planctomycetia bacterium]
MIDPVASLQPPVLFAAGIDWLEAVLPILFVGFWILSQVFAVLRRAAGGPARPPVVRVPDAVRDDAARPRPLAQPEVDPRAELDKQIADFLRQVTGEAPRTAPERTRTQPPPLRPESSPQPRVEKRPPSPAVLQPPRPALAQARSAGERTQPVGERHVGTLDVQSSDVARHVQDAFKQQLGHLHSGLERPGDETPGTEAPRRVGGGRMTARDLVAAARDPATIRQAILLREILERPVDRW